MNDKWTEQAKKNQIAMMQVAPGDLILFSEKDCDTGRKYVSIVIACTRNNSNVLLLHEETCDLEELVNSCADGKIEFVFNVNNEYAMLAYSDFAQMCAIEEIVKV